jgi:hypothetical protein
MNNRDPEMFLPETDFKIIQNYYCYPSRLRGRGPETTGVSLTGTQAVKGLHNWQNASFAERLIATSDTTITSIDSAWAATDITAPVTITNGACSSVSFNHRLFLTNGTDLPISITTGLVCANPAFTGPSSNVILKQTWSYKNRLYFTERDSSKIWYGDVDAIAGALTAVDLDSIFTVPSYLLFGINGTMNQGLQNEEYCIFVSQAGEVLIYSGDSPEAANWTITARAKINKPLSFRSYCKIGGDVMIYTVSGIVRLSDVISTSAPPAEQFKLTDKISGGFQLALPGAAPAYPSSANRALMVLDGNQPFIYCIMEDAVYVLNAQTGAWSYFTTNAAPTAIAYAFGFLVFGYSADPEITYMDSSSVITPNLILYTGALDLGVNLVKKVTAVRITTTPLSSDTSKLRNTQVIVTSDLTGAQAADGKLLTGAPGIQQSVVEYNPGIIGRHFTVYYEVSAGGTSLRHDFLALEIDYETGGVY